MGDARRDVLAFATAQTRRCSRLRHSFLPCPLGLLGDRFLAGDRPRRTLARAGIGMSALSPHRQPLAMAQAPIAAEIHQPLDVHGHLAAQIAFDRVVVVDDLADAQHLVVGQLMHPPLRRDGELLTDLLGGGPADAVDIGEADRNPLLARDVDASNTRHLRFSLRGVLGQKTAARPRARIIGMPAPKSMALGADAAIRPYVGVSGRVSIAGPSAQLEASDRAEGARIAATRSRLMQTTSSRLLAVKSK